MAASVWMVGFAIPIAFLPQHPITIAGALFLIVVGLVILVVAFKKNLTYFYGYLIVTNIRVALIVPERQYPKQ